MAWSDEDKQAMDNAAIDAEQELNQLLTPLNQVQELEPTAQDLIDWWYKWYMTAGHKRLGRVLVQIAKEKEGG